MTQEQWKTTEGRPLGVRDQELIAWWTLIRICQMQRGELARVQRSGVQTRTRKSLVLSKSYYRPSPPLLPIAKCVSNSCSEFLRQTHFQAAVTVGNRINIILSRLVALEELFDSRPSDVAEQRRRDGLIRYVILSPFSFVLCLSPLQRVWTHSRETRIVSREDTTTSGR